MKILSVASAGGHWVELLRLMPAFDEKEVIFMSTNPQFAETVKNHRYFNIPDFSQWNKFRFFSIAWRIARVIRAEKPDVIITTGAAPGVVALLVGKLFGAKTIWIESMCHAEKLSISGKMALLFADRVYTQWKHLADKNIVYAGNVML